MSTDAPEQESLVPGLVSVTFRQLGVPDVVALVADAGLAAIEWGGDVHVPVGDLAAAERARALCAERGIEVASYGSYHRAGSGTPEELAAVVDTAAALGAPSIRVWAGTAGSAETTAAERAAVVDGLRRAVELAGGRDIGVALEFHRNTLTDTVASTRRLLDEVGATGVGEGAGVLTTYWQPRIGADDATGLAEVVELWPDLSTLHVFSWAPDGERLALAGRESLWRPVLDRVRRDDRRHHALLEFVRADTPEQFAADAATLLAWLSSAD